MRLVFIYGPAAAGKLTIARAVAARTGFGVFHNHLIVDALTAVFQFGTPPFIELRERMWLEVFREAARSDTSLLFTFAPERTVRHDFPCQAAIAVEGMGGQIHFVQLTCPLEILEARVEEPSRREFDKLSSVERFRELRAAGMEKFPPLPTDLEIDTSQCGPDEAAALIVERFQLDA